MMPNTSLDFYGLEFWLMVGLTVLLVGGLSGPMVRAWGLALMNLAALTLLVHWRIIVVFAGLVAVWLGLRLIALSRIRSLVLIAGGVVTLGLFLLHKRPEAFLRLGLPGVQGFLAILTIVGFSYLSLRLVDVTRAVSDGRELPSLAGTINYLIPFHMLAAGPIQSYDDFVAQPSVPPAPDIAKSLEALELIAAGLFKKYVVANTIQSLFLTGYSAGGWYTIIEIQLSYIWLYLDFSAYSDVALGVGQLMGVATPVNFQAPYRARNLIEYWERWHITLSQFIRRHVFIPIHLSLTRRSGGAHPLLSASVAFMVSFLLCGLWHSVGPRWLLWGGLHAVGLIVCNLYRSRLLKNLGRKGINAYLENRWLRALGITVTFEFVAFSLAAATYPFDRLPWWPNYPG
jgi:D-alanyl-lipoteichoic acid acyltransferase DltB (MBOAT superfamily)